MLESTAFDRANGKHVGGDCPIRWIATWPDMDMKGPPCGAADCGTGALLLSR